ncbi:alpha-2-HS-glycoprotein 2 [Thalassophryne amazonica]|uniref:alpha-2-HS-glycoprotein 2 n=1 Tax=Thalassophryne amazonica TaxID=390379 RepID=UPI00147097A4|nr:alpha-2-HS-glycoprotein 2 [Thalassophryne amazonica]
MNFLSFAVVLGLFMGAWAVVIPNKVQLPCDSPEAEAAALVAQDYLNAQHTHGYKYILNRIEDIKLYTKPGGDDAYVLEVDLLETDCHVLDPTPVANCTVRPKVLTVVEGDCDVVLKKAGEAFTVTAFKCKTEESTEDLCLGCPTLLPLNHTGALDFVHASFNNFNNKTDKTFTILETGRMMSQLVSGGMIYKVEYVVAEANCTGDSCVPLSDPTAAYGICHAEGVNTAHKTHCKMFPVMTPVVDVNSTAAPAPAAPPVVHVHTGTISPKHGLKYHKLTTHHDPLLSGLLSAESAESNEVVPAAPPTHPAAPAVATAGPTPAADPASASDSSGSIEIPVILTKRQAPVLPPPLCPGKVKFF